MCFFAQEADGQLKETQRRTEIGGGIVKLVDINLDGRLVLVTRGSNLRVRLQSADGTWLPSAEYPSGIEGFYGNALAFADVNGDGRVDVISGTKVLLQRVVPTMAASLTHSRLGQPIRAGVRAMVDAKLRQ